MATRKTSWIRCPDCEPSLHRPLAERLKWSSRTVDSPSEWDGSIIAVLQQWARDVRGSFQLRSRHASPAADTDPRQLAVLRREAEFKDLVMHGLINRGPVQSRPDWEREVEAADAASRSAWKKYADAVYSTA